MLIELTVPDAVIPLLRAALRAPLVGIGVDPTAGLSDSELVERQVREVIEGLVTAGKLLETEQARRVARAKVDSDAHTAVRSFVTAAGISTRTR